MEKHGKEYPTFPLPFSFQLLLFKSLKDFRPLCYCKTTFRTERREESKQQVVSLCVGSCLPLLLKHKAVQSLGWRATLHVHSHARCPSSFPSAWAHPTAGAAKLSWLVAPSSGHGVGVKTTFSLQLLASAWGDLRPLSLVCWFFAFLIFNVILGA